MEGLLLVSLRILRAVNALTPGNEQQAQRLLKLNNQRDTLLSALPGGAPQTAADHARWELVRYVNTIAQKKTAAKI